MELEHVVDLVARHVDAIEVVGDLANQSNAAGWRGPLCILGAHFLSSGSLVSRRTHYQATRIPECLLVQVKARPLTPRVLRERRAAHRSGRSAGQSPADPAPRRESPPTPASLPRAGRGL